MFTNDLQPENLNTIATFSSLNKQHEALHMENVFFLMNFSDFLNIFEHIFHTICYLYIYFMYMF